ncbi:MAG: hypothetical protein H6834_15645, partial [Planctomycetes bacterium]|nr:hypothetical protein [Planctomycetota bacterium]
MKYVLGVLAIALGLLAWFAFGSNDAQLFDLESNTALREDEVVGDSLRAERDGGSG